MDIKKSFASWSISLDTTCPACDHDFDMLDDADFWCDTSIKPIEQDTPSTTGVEVVCPKCDNEFLVDFQY